MTHSRPRIRTLRSWLATLLAMSALCASAPAWAGGWGPTIYGNWFSLRPGSPEVVPANPNYSPADIFIGGFFPPPNIPPGVPFRPHYVFGLQMQHNIDGIAWGGAPPGVTYPPGGNNIQNVYFSVDEPTVGIAPAIVNQVAGDGAQGDIFGQQNQGNNLGPIQVHYNANAGLGNNLGLTPNASCVDAWANAMPAGNLANAALLYSVDPATAAFLGVDPADILWNVPGGPAVQLYATRAALGLVPGDDIDGLDCSAYPAAGAFAPIAAGDNVYFSLDRGSPTLVANGWSAADILYIVFGAMGAPAVWANANDLGLKVTDNIDALDIWDPGYEMCGDGDVIENHLGHRCPDNLPGAMSSSRSGVLSTPPSRLASPASVPSAVHSSVSPCLVVCPRGDIPFEVTVRDVSNLPMPGASVVLDFADCPGFDPCPEDSGYVITPSSKVFLTADGLGVATLLLRSGGACPAGSVRVYAEGYLLATRGMASPDQNADGIVTGLDRDLLIPKGGTSDPSGDLDCDGNVTCVYSAVVDVPDLHVPAAFHASFGPNPIRAGELAFVQIQLPEAADFVIELFDVSGRLVHRELAGGLAPGTWRLPWRVPVGISSGMYALRVAGGRNGATLKAVIIQP